MRAPRATNAHAACRHCPSYAGRLSQEKPMLAALVSVTRYGACFDEYIRSAVRYIAQVPSVIHVWVGVRVSGKVRPSCIT